MATLPAVTHGELLQRIIAHPLVTDVRYNTAMKTKATPEQALSMINGFCQAYDKNFWLDIKGRDLRITRSAKADTGEIVLNHTIKVTGPAKVYFRNDRVCNFVGSEGRVVYVDPAPKYLVGEGQSVNIVGDNVQITGYHTHQDYNHMREAAKIGITHYLLSFTEQVRDVESTARYLAKRMAPSWYEQVVYGLKIESQDGMWFVDSFPGGLASCCLMAARDDMYIHTGDDKSRMIEYLRLIIKKDPNAWCASKIFDSLLRLKKPAWTDWSDLYLMRQMGYRKFLLGDDLCKNFFDDAMKAWEESLRTFGPLN